MPVVGDLILGELAGRVARRAEPYVTRARWRAGPLGQPVPRAPRRMPSPNPPALLGGALARRGARAAAMRARAAAMRASSRSLGRSGPGSRAVRL